MRMANSKSAPSKPPRKTGGGSTKAPARPQPAGGIVKQAAARAKGPAVAVGVAAAGGRRRAGAQRPDRPQDRARRPSPALARRREPAGSRREIDREDDRSGEPTIRRDVQGGREGHRARRRSGREHRKAAALVGIL